MENQVDHNAFLRVGLDLLGMKGKEEKMQATIHHAMEKRARITLLTVTGWSAAIAK